MIILCGLILDPLLHLVPIFYGIEITRPDATGEMPASMVWILGLAFLLPVSAIVSVNYLNNKAGRIINLVLAGVALLVGTGHLSEFFISEKVDPTTLFVIPVLFLVGILLAVDSWKLFKFK
ncbi:MAG: hypothetical protein CSA96_01340 [Bacteroidetes bacterium]|nr:MAG: hypothetical protein CSA96_01340 [Bacteroidota bacterium]